MNLDTSNFNVFCLQAETAFRRLARTLGLNRVQMTRRQWLVCWLRWRAVRPPFEAGELWPHRYTVWLMRRPERVSSGFQIDGIVALLCGTVLYLGFQVFRWMI